MKLPALRRLFLGLAVWLASIAALCAADQVVPPYSSPIVDTTGTLSAAAQRSLEAKLLAYEAHKGSQLAVLIVPTTEPETIEQFGIRVADTWKPGRKRVEDGAILIVAKNDRGLRIEVGRGLEGALTDAASKRIIEEVILPYFRRADFEGGIQAGVDAMLKTMSGEPLPAPQGREGGGIGDYFMPLLVLFLVGGNILVSVLGRVGGATVLGVLVSIITSFFLALSIALMAGLAAFFLTLFGIFSAPYGGRGRWSNRGFGGYSSGGRFGGGGFAGGGGGGFSGGGASGRW